MTTLTGSTISLRALEPEDLSFLSQIENDESLWEVSNTTQPFSNYILRQYIENSHKDIFEIKQLRLVIEINANKTVVGFIDLFEFEPKHKRAGIGIVLKKEYQNNGYASEAIKLIIKYSFEHLNTHQLYANILEGNKKSIKLFEKHNFTKSGIKKDWIFNNGEFKNELTYQLLNE